MSLEPRPFTPEQLRFIEYAVQIRLAVLQENQQLLEKQLGADVVQNIHIPAYQEILDKIKTLKETTP